MTTQEQRTAIPAVEESAAELMTFASVEMTARNAPMIPEVAELLPADTRVYVTWLPGQPLEDSLLASIKLREAGLDPVPHIAARRIPSREAMHRFAARAVRDAGVRRILLIGGDVDAPEGPYADSVALLREGVFAEAGVQEIGVAGYPEGHPRIAREALDAAFDEKRRLAQAQGLGTHVVTQFSFAPQRIVEFCASMYRRAPDVPIYVGIPGPTTPMALMRYAQRCGVSASLRALGSLGFAAAKLVTHTDPDAQVLALAGHLAARPSSNVVGVHFYSFGELQRTARWINRAIAQGVHAGPG